MKYRKLDKCDKEQIKKVVEYIAEVLAEELLYTGNIQLNFFEGNLINANFNKKHTFKVNDG